MSSAAPALLALFITPILFSIIRSHLKHRCLSNLPGPEPQSWLFGVAKKMFAPDGMTYRLHLLTESGPVVKIPFLLGVRILNSVHRSSIAISDPLGLCTLLGKDSTPFDFPHSFVAMSHAVWGPSLIGVRVGDEHRKQRKILNPVFSVPHLRGLVPVFSDVASEVVSTINSYLTGAPTEVDVSQIITGYSLECIGRTGLGRSFGSLKEHGTPYSRALKEFGPTLGKLHVFMAYLPGLRKCLPLSWLRFGAKHFPMKAMRDMLEISDTVYAESKRILTEKEGLLKDEGGRDLMSIILRHNAKVALDEVLSEEALIGQMSMFLLAATDTTSSTITRVIELLAINQDVQGGLREELTRATESRSLSEFDFDAFASLQYLDAVLRETLRMKQDRRRRHRHPPFRPVVGKDGELIHEVHIPAGTTILVNNVGYNRSPLVWGPSAAEWRPGRWLAPLPDSATTQRVPTLFSNMLSFGGGPRACIGYNMALIELRVIISHLILAFRFTPSDKKIVWRMAGLVSPSVRGSKLTRPELPVMIERLAVDEAA
ncbi:cytochrome P450 [Epithele typhae]|uniref:cytochrome P450 n=1 Tax=Epithele typhae TaxID=378194 RepID=UPI002008AA80|nr:cytochrome P450 [Epithele typhae]KAH9917675.1 cytochrome P450 [Epithele typhae]